MQRPLSAGFRALVMLLTGLGAASAGDDPAPVGPRRAEADRRDVHSFGNPDRVRVKHLRLDLAVDFDRKQLRGVAEWTIDRTPGGDGPATLVLDTRDLAIEAISAPDAAEVPFRLGRADAILGAPLTIDLPGDAASVRIKYRTSPGASALQWVDPAGTAGGKKPFLFTQSQAIHARSWIPCQDSPGVRVTYEARIEVPDGFKAVMSADAKGVEGRACRFDMPQAIPSYLIAMAVGDLDTRPIGRRTGVWAEPSVVGKAADEFADTESMVEAAEALVGPYRWGRYDLLILPPSFPFGGMENAKLTFATPTVLAGDRSLVALVAHELAHSWSGNLVTGATWRDFWLNEGFTTYLERRIVEALYGPERAAMEAALGLVELREEIARLAPRDEVLHIDLKGRNPDDGMTRVAYEKGALFLTRLEKTFGRDRFDAYLKGYFDRFAFKSIITADFERDLREHLFATEPGRAEPIDLHAWLHEPGLPADAPEPRAARFDEVDRQARLWVEGKAGASELETDGWSTHEWLRFLRDLPARLSPDRMAELDEALHLTGRGNAEVAAIWLELAIRHGYRPADDRLEEFLATVGRRKFLMPLYTELARTPAGKARARAIYARARPGYHPIAVESVDRLLGPP